MNLSPQVIDVIKERLLKPADSDSPSRSLHECFVPSETVTAKHVLADALISGDYPKLPKLVLYIVMDQVYGQCTGKAADGSAGYYLRYSPTEPENLEDPEEDDSDYPGEDDAEDDRWAYCPECGYKDGRHDINCSDFPDDMLL